MLVDENLVCKGIWLSLQRWGYSGYPVGDSKISQLHCIQHYFVKRSKSVSSTVTWAEDLCAPKALAPTSHQLGFKVSM
jgi:hypothetical protein